MPRIYLDNSATSWPKPDIVYETLERFQRDNGASAGRGAYQSAQQAQRIVADTRAACARLLGTGDPTQIIFTSNGSAALNIAIHGLLRPGDHVVATVCEHNSVLRPLNTLASQNQVQVTYVHCDAAGYVSPADIASAIQPNTRIVAVNHASNVIGVLQPISDIAEVVQKSDAYLLVDAAQTAGSVPIDVTQQGIDLLACGGHKGLLGPQGTGLLYMRPGLEKEIRPTYQGGTGTDSLTESQPEPLPDKFEAGSLNLPALAGLGAAVKHLEQETVEAVQKHHSELITQFLAGLAEIPTIKVYGPQADQPRVAVAGCAVEGYDPQEFAAALDVAAGVECRAGLHCAPRMHAALGTTGSGGLVRFSPGWATTPDEIEQALAAISALAAAPVH